LEADFQREAVLEHQGLALFWTRGTWRKIGHDRRSTRLDSCEESTGYFPQFCQEKTGIRGAAELWRANRGQTTFIGMTSFQPCPGGLDSTIYEF